MDSRTAPQMIGWTRDGEGKAERPRDLAIKVRVDDVYEQIATVTVYSAVYIEYLQLVRTPEGWRIVNSRAVAMDDSRFGKEDSRGFWTPKEPVSYGPAFDWPPRPRALLKWFFGFPGYLLPWNVLYAVAAILIWMFLTPSLETLKTFSFSWAGLILLRNIGLAILVYGAWHLWLYVWRKQGTAFKYNRQWPKKSLGLSVQQPDIRQYVLHPGERRADMDGL